MEEYKNSIFVIFEIIDGKEKFLEMISCYNDEEIRRIIDRLKSFENRHIIVTSLKNIDKKYINILKRDSEGIIKINKRKIKKI
ncbi:hypothetical protein [Candidatus Darwinibacter acetoxidans]